jgi:hypothetical protein
MAKKITENDLIQLLDKTSAETIKVVSRKECKMNKTNNPFYKKEGRKWVPVNVVEKQNVITYLYGGGTYEERVNEALKADGSTNTFESRELPWGEWFIMNKIIKYGANFYVRCYLDINNTGTKEYFVDGKPATAEQLKLIDEWEIKDKDYSERQLTEGLTPDKQVYPQSVKFENIVTIEVDGVEYELA